MENSIWAIERELRIIKNSFASYDALQREVRMWRRIFLSQQTVPNGPDAELLSTVYGKFNFAKSEDILRQGPEHWLEVIKSETEVKPGLVPVAPDVAS